jgi:mono/diheme cytochrome c family protein
LPGTSDYTNATFWETHSDDEILSIIINGVDGTTMPGWSQLSDEEIEDTLKYLKSFAGVT